MENLWRRESRGDTHKEEGELENMTQGSLKRPCEATNMFEPAQILSQLRIHVTPRASHSPQQHGIWLQCSGVISVMTVTIPGELLKAR